MPALELPPPPWIVGHRGVRGPVPENTAASVREAVTQGADMVELDLQLTAGGELVVYHDRTVPLPGGGEKAVARLTRQERRRCRAVWRCGDAELPYPIPTLEEVLAAAPAALPLNLELKQHEPDLEPGPLIEAVGRAVAGRGGILVSSFAWPLLAALRDRLPGLPVAPLGGRSAGGEELLATARRLGAFSVHLHHQRVLSLAEEGLLEAAVAERPILAYTVNRGRQARALVGLGVTGLFTDRPAALRRELRG